MWLVDGGTNLATIEVSSIRGEKAVGFHRLVVNLRFSIYPRAAEQQPVVIRDIAGDLRLQGPASYVGRLVPRDAPVILQSATFHQPRLDKTFVVELDRQRLNSIEDVRLGRDLIFSLKIWGVAEIGSRIFELSDEQSYHTPQGLWVELLADLGYANTLLLEIPAPNPGQYPELAAASSHLARAQEAMANGAWREAVGHCRDSLEALAVAKGDRDEQDQAFQPMFERSRELDKLARLRLLRRATKVLTHPARHADEVSASIEWDRRDAQTVISVVAALLQRGVRD